MSSLPLITAIIRLLALVFTIKALEQIFSSISLFVFQLAGPVAPYGPAIWLVFGGVVIFYLALGVGLFCAAPALARLILPRDSADLPVAPSSTVTLNEVLIFCTAFALAGWAFIQIAEWVAGEVLQCVTSHQPFNPDPSALIRFFTPAIVFVASAIVCSRFVSIHRWMERKKSGLS